MFEEQLAKLPTEPPRQPDALPGLRLAAVVPKAALFLPLIFIAFFAVIPLSVMQSNPAMRLSLGQARTSQARVVSTVPATACRSSVARRVVYAFTPEPGREVRGAGTLCEESPYYSVKEGDGIEVKYLASDPAINMVRTGSPNGSPPFALFFLMPLFFLAMLSPMFMPQIREVLRARRMFKKGRLVTGTVVFIKKRSSGIWPGWPGNSASDVYVQLQLSSGERREAIAWCQNDWLLNCLAPGASVHLAYLDEMPGKATLLEAFLR